MNSRSKLFVGLGLIIAAAPLRAQNLVVNPGFETGDFSGWTESGGNSDGVSSGAHTGLHAAFFAPSAGFGDDTLTQTIPTTTGAYRIDFWVQGFSNAFSPNDFVSATWGGNSLPFSVPADNTYHLYSFLTSAPTGSQDLAFTFSQDREGGANLDDVSVQAVPEPTTWSILGLGVFAALRRRRHA